MRASESLKITSTKINFAFPIICVYYSPGDRAQKVIPGGAKTNESFWKSQNNVKKSILRFPSYVYYSPGHLCSPFGDFWHPLETLRSSLGRQVALEAELWGHNKFRNKNKQISSSIRQKMKRWSPKLERQHHFFWKSLKTIGSLMILRVGEPRAGAAGSPALENARTP